MLILDKIHSFFNSFTEYLYHNAKIIPTIEILLKPVVMKPEEVVLPDRWLQQQ